MTSLHPAFGRKRSTFLILCQQVGLFSPHFPIGLSLDMHACLAGEEHSSLDTYLPSTSTTTTTTASTSSPHAYKPTTVVNSADVAAIVLAADDSNSQSSLGLTQDMVLNIPSSLARPSSKSSSSKRSLRPATAPLVEDRIQNLPEVCFFC